MQTISPLSSSLSTQELPVALESRSYTITIGYNLLDGIGEQIKPLLPLPHVFIVTDTEVEKHYLRQLITALDRAHTRHHHYVIPAGEQSKSFAMLEEALDAMLAAKVERKTTLLAFGGGVVGDLTGFAASILLRGVPFIQIPTTLLAMVDSSVGGKTGINTAYGKNLVGSFYQPQTVIADMALLQTLPKREFLAGYAEIVKYGLIHKPDFFAWLVANEAKIHARDAAWVQQAVYESCQSKADIVSQDEREGGVRALLNLGHTFGHALEAEMSYDGRLLHGEAVAIGMVMAAAFSARIGVCGADIVTRLVAHLQAVGLPTHPRYIHPTWDREALVAHMYQDKKVSQGALVFILLKAIGGAYIAKDVNPDDIRAFLTEFLH